MNVIRILWVAAVMTVLAFACLRPSIAATGKDDEEHNRRRLAIVIGNSNYESGQYPDLANAATDAERLAETLKRLNFDVTAGIDLTASQFEEIFARYANRLNEYSAVLIFYSGHGIQFNDVNYLLPVDSLDPETVDKLIERAVKLNEVIERFASRDRQTFVFLDACRDSLLGANGTGNGLARQDVPENTFIAFATQPGNVASDGLGTNSPFTMSLLQNMEIPGLNIWDLMIRVRNGTEKLTLGQQVPWDQSNLREQFYFTEQQQLDPGELNATLSRILAEPAIREQLLVQLASADSDLQSAVVMLGKKLPAVRAAEDGANNQQFGSVDRGDGSRDDVASDLKQLLVHSEPQDGDKPLSLDLSYLIQTELARVGCYRPAVNGGWGPGSRKALGEYLKRTNQQQAALEPSVDLLSDLFLRTGRICTAPIAVKLPNKATFKASTGKANKLKSDKRARIPARN